MQTLNERNLNPTQSMSPLNQVLSTTTIRQECVVDRKINVECLGIAQPFRWTHNDDPRFLKLSYHGIA